MDSRQLQLVLALQDNASRELRKVAGELGKVEGATQKTSSSFWGFSKSIAGVASAYISLQGAFDAFSAGIRTAADLETAEVGLKTLLGSAEEAASTIERIKTEAARTPFELAGLAQATQLLTSVTKDGDKSIDTILDIGEGLTAMGKGQTELDRIIVNLQQIAATGKAATIDIKQFAFAGIPIYEMLAETTGKTGEELGKFVEDGGVTFDLLTEMFDKANDSGGRFFDAYKNNAGTFNQLYANMSENFKIMLTEIVQGTGIFDGLKTAMAGVVEATGDWRGTLTEVKTSFSEAMDLFDEKTLIITHVKSALGEIANTYNTFLKPALEELGAKLVELKPLWEAMGTVFSGFLVVSAHILVVALQGLIGILVIVLRYITDIATFITDVFLKAIDLLSDAFIWLADYGKQVAGGIDVVKDSISGLYDWFVKIIGKAERFIELLADMGGNAADFVKGKLSGTRAMGGPVSSSGAYLVGENGPELFKPNTNGTIIPNYAIAGSTPSGVNITIYGDVTGQEIVDKVGRALMENINSRIRI